MYVMTKEQAQEWLNRPEHEEIGQFWVRGDTMNALWRFAEGDTWQYLPFSVDFIGELTRKKPWHWPESDENTKLNADGFCKRYDHSEWERCHYCGNAGGNIAVFKNGKTSWTSRHDPQGSFIYVAAFVLANPDNLDEVPPIGLEV